MRTYTVNSVESPSVTTVLALLDKSDALIPWAVRSATSFIRTNKGDRDRYPTLDALLAAAESEWRNQKETAADIGSEIHKAIEDYIASPASATIASRQEVQHGFNAFREWEEAHKVQWLASELTIYHPEFHYAGTLDAICLLDGKKYVVDFKSSKGFYDTFGMQIAAYRLAAKAMGHEIDGCGILRLDKTTGLPEWKDYTKRQERDCYAFLRLLDFWYSAAHRRLKNNPRCCEGKI